MEVLEKQDIQGFLLKGYGRMRHTRYALLRVEDPGLAKTWLARISLEVSDGNHQPVRTCLNIAFTHAGLQALGLGEDNLRRFSREFREGMPEPHRQRLLGDEGPSSPDGWRWGGNGDAGAGLKNIHTLLMVFADTSATLHEYWAQLEPAITAHGLRVLTNLDGALHPDNKESFGFSDGISQPLIEGDAPDTDPDQTVAAGEFILGYKNEYGVYPESPVIAASPQQGDVSLLPTIAAGQKDLGRNGSYLVFRQMQQHVDEFWAFIRRNSSGDSESIKLASRMVGRWPSGAPLALYPDSDPGGRNDENDFGYAQLDKEGLRCPIGSHVRRTNPRDLFEGNAPAHSLRLTKKHRIIRRGRSYRLARPPAAAGEPHQEEVGLHFMCFNSDISHQFEFIQHTWCKNPKFDHLYNDPDPFIGVVGGSPPGLEQDFTVQGCPVNRRVHNLESFVTIRGGAYFFFPSITAIRYFASL